MADRWRRDVQFPAGTTTAKNADVGPDDPTPEEPAVFGSLRVGFDGIESVSGFTAVVRLPEGHEVGPLDLPCIFGCELPVRVDIRPPTGGVVADTKVKLSASSMTPANVADGATWAAVILEAAIIDIPAWVTGISILSAGVNANLIDATAAIIDVVTGFRIPRPRAAVQIQPAADTIVLFHYDL